MRKIVFVILSIIVSINMIINNNLNIKADEEGILVKYDFEDNLQDSSGYGNHGSYEGNVIYQDGYSGKAINLDGSGWINLPQDIIKNYETFTVSLRFKTSSKGGILGYQNFEIGNDQVTYLKNYVPILSVGVDGKLYALMWTGAEMKVTSSTVVNDNTWHQVVMTSGKDYIKVYLDGVNIGQVSGVPIHLDMGFNQIGLTYSLSRSYLDSTKWSYFNGLIDDFMIYSTVQQPDTPSSLFAFNTGKIISYTGTDVDVVIPNMIDGQVVEILGNSSFLNKSIQNLEIPNCVEVIEDSAFKGNNLTELILPNSINQIGQDAFNGNPITSIQIGSNVDINTLSTNTMGVYGESFQTLYSSNNKKSGTYKYENSSWIYILPKYNVTFIDFDGTELDTQLIEEGKAAIVPTNPSRDGYTFAGWDKTFDSITEDTIITATYFSDVFTVTFIDYDQTILDTQTIEPGEAAIAPTNPSRNGYTFSGWDKAFDNITEDITITATYVINTYTVTFKDYDGTILDSITVNYGSSATSPSAPTRTGYSFTGWDKSFDSITEDITITAIYSEISSYTVIFKDYNGTVLNSQTVNKGNDAIAPNNPSRDGYKFIGWDISYDNVNENITVTATYVKDDTLTYYIMFTSILLIIIFIIILFIKRDKEDKKLKELKNNK